MKKPSTKSTQADVWGSEPEAKSTQDAAPKTTHGFEPLPEDQPHPTAKKTPTMTTVKSFKIYRPNGNDRRRIPEGILFLISL